MPAAHTLLMQSPAQPHRLPAAQGEHDPPQSTSVSMPFALPSSHAAAAHAPLSHTLLLQSRASVQAWPGSQPEQAPPPQSTSLSLPLS